MRNIVSDKRIKQGRAVAIISCPEEIPCNPCETICPFQAITVGTPITNLPVFHQERCTGCGKCITVCPGLAISVLNYNYSSTEAALTVPYELLPRPAAGDKITAVDAAGRPVAAGKIVRVSGPEKNNGTALVTFSFARKYYRTVRFFRKKQ